MGIQIRKLVDLMISSIDSNFLLKGPNNVELNGQQFNWSDPHDRDSKQAHDGAQNWLTK